MDWRPTRAEPPYVLALDVGTSSTRASLYDAGARPVAGLAVQLAYAPALTPDGGAELDADALVEQVAAALDQLAALAGPALGQVEAVATSTFWHSLVGVGRDGRAVTPVYLWLDARSRAEARALQRLLDERAVHARTGCVLHWSYLPAKLRWVARQRPEQFRAAERWLSFGEYLLLRLFGATGASVSIASGSGLFDQHRCDWDDELLAVAGIERRQLAPIRRLSAPHVGLRPEYARRWPPLRGIPWLPAVGDGACSNLGAGCATRERYALMVGTSGALRVVWRADALTIPWGVWCYRVDERRPVLGGAINDGGSLVGWLRQTLQLPPNDATEEALARLEPDAHGLTVLPFWGGERSTGWAADATGAIVGLRLATTPLEILRAALEAVALRLAAIARIVERVVPEAREAIATGGALLRSPAWLQIMADALGRPVRASAVAEASSRGAALLALETLGLLPGGSEALPPPVERTYEPVPAHTERYRAAAARQARLYEQLIGSAAGP